MAIDLITGHQGVAHISAEQIANINNALMDDYGVDKVVRLDDGTLTQDGLTINVGTGFWRVNGFDMEIQEAETVYIDPTATGLSRIDNIYVEILQDIPTGSQRSEIVTVQGEAAASPVAPDAPTAPVLNTDILLQVTPLATVTVTEGAMVMTDLSVAYEMVTPQELAAVQTIAENAQTAAGNAQTTADNANTKAINALNQISDSDDAYSPSKAYKVGEHCIYNNVLYKCITACSAAAWSVNQSCFTSDTLSNAVTLLNTHLTNVGSFIDCGYANTGNAGAQTLALSAPKTLPKGNYLCHVTIECSTITANVIAVTVLGNQCTCYKNANGFGVFRATMPIGLANATAVNNVVVYLQTAEAVKIDVMFTRLQ
jgi:hypothetical protein